MVTIDEHGCVPKNGTYVILQSMHEFVFISVEIEHLLYLCKIVSVTYEQ